MPNDQQVELGGLTPEKEQIVRGAAEQVARAQKAVRTAQARFEALVIMGMPEGAERFDLETMKYYGSVASAPQESYDRTEPEQTPKGET